MQDVGRYGAMVLGELERVAKEEKERRNRRKWDEGALNSLGAVAAVASSCSSSCRCGRTSAGVNAEVSTDS